MRGDKIGEAGEEAGDSRFTSGFLFHAFYLLWFRFVPFYSLSWNNLHIRSIFQKIDTDTSQGVDTPLRVSIIPEVVRKEGFQVLGECTSHNSVACTAHDPRLENKVVLRQCYSKGQQFSYRQAMFRMNRCTMCSGGL